MPTNLCRYQDCSVAPVSVFYCESHAEELLRHLYNKIEAVMAVAGGVYLGRTNHPERRLLEHHKKEGRNFLTVLHWAADWSEVDALETAVIAMFKHRLKLENISEDSEGRHHGAWNCVYASWALMNRNKSMEVESTPVDTLCWRKRLWPCKDLPMSPVTLSTRMSQERAGRELEEWRFQNEINSPTSKRKR